MVQLPYSVVYILYTHITDCFVRCRVELKGIEIQQIPPAQLQQRGGKLNAERNHVLFLTRLSISLITAGNHRSTPQHPDHFHLSKNVNELIMAEEKRRETQLWVLKNSSKKII